LAELAPGVPLAQEIPALIELDFGFFDCAAIIRDALQKLASCGHRLETILVVQSAENRLRHHSMTITNLMAAGK
jgi:hypothetical protein